MAKRPTINTLANTASPTYLTQLNQNFTNIRDQFDNTLSLDGSTPNAMNADIDLNGNDILNVGSLNTASLVLDGVEVGLNSLSPVDNITSRAAFVAANTTTPGLGLVNGQVVFAEGVAYRRLVGSATISDLPGWIWNGTATPNHFATNTTPGTTDMTAAFAAALASSDHIELLRQTYVVSNLAFRTGVTLSGAGGRLTGWSDTYEGSVSRIHLTGGTGSAITASVTPMNHISFRDVVITVGSAYDYAIDMQTIRGFDLYNVFLFIPDTQTTTGGIRTLKGVATDSSWVAHFSSVNVRIPDASTKRPLDIDMSDSSIAGCAFTGGIGNRIRSGGGIKVVGNRFDRATGDCVTIDVAALNPAGVPIVSQQIISSNQIEEFDGAGLVVNADADDANTPAQAMTGIIGNTFRPRVGSTACIEFRNSTGSPIAGGTIVGNTNATTRPFFIYDPTQWTDIVVSGNNMLNAAGNSVDTIGNLTRQYPLVLAHSGLASTHTGTLTETVIRSVTVPANTLGANGAIRIRAVVTANNDANNKFVRIFFGGTLFCEVTLQNLSGGVLEHTIQNRNSTASQVGSLRSSFGPGTTAVVGAVLTGTLDTTLDQTLELRFQHTDAADTLILVQWSVDVVPFA